MHGLSINQGVNVRDMCALACIVGMRIVIICHSRCLEFQEFGGIGGTR